MGLSLRQTSVLFKRCFVLSNRLPLKFEAFIWIIRIKAPTTRTFVGSGQREKMLSVGYVDYLDSPNNNLDRLLFDRWQAFFPLYVSRLKHIWHSFIQIIRKWMVKEIWNVDQPTSNVQLICLQIMFASGYLWLVNTSRDHVERNLLELQTGSTNRKTILCHKFYSC